MLQYIRNGVEIPADEPPTAGGTPHVGGQTVHVRNLEPGERSARGGVLEILRVQTHHRFAT
jgi:hypothetical protein